MTPEKFKSDVQAAYKEAVSHTNSWVSYHDDTLRIFDGVALYSRDAAIDFVRTEIAKILQEAVKAAEAKRRLVHLRPGRIGKAALAGIVDTLKETTGLPVTEGNGVITIAWAKDEPDLY